jgi:hypothetical protein
VSGVNLADVLAVIRRDLDPATREIVEAMVYDAHRLTVIRDAFMEGRDALAVKMIRDLDPLRKMERLPLSADLRNRRDGGPDGVYPGGSGRIIARPQTSVFRPRLLILARATAEAVDINDIQVGLRSQFAQAGDVPGEMFAIDMPEGTLDLLDGLAVNGPDGLDPIYTLHVNARGVERLLLPLDFEPAELAMDVSITFTNISERPLARFRGAFIGATGCEVQIPSIIGTAAV